MLINNMNKGMDIMENKKLKIMLKVMIIIILICLMLFVLGKKNNKIVIESNILSYKPYDSSYELQQTEVADGTTYYISATGTSEDGTDINNPMSLEIANNKTYTGNDKILFKSGDVFYGIIYFKIESEQGKNVYIGSYGEGDKPILSGANILINRNAWQLDNDLYKIDLSNYNNFEGIGNTIIDPYNIGFLADDKDNIYASRKKTKDEVVNEYEYYCENNYLFIKCSENPSDKLGKIKFVSNINLVYLSSNTVLENLNIQYTGAHGIAKKTENVNNVHIKDCIIQNIGGSVQIADTFTRYGNGIEFWNQAENVIIERNIVRNVYDAAITLQGKSGSFNNIEIKNNILISNCYSLELWASKTSEGMNNVNIYNNITVNQGISWAQEVRPNPYNSAEYVFYTYGDQAQIGINIYANYFYNSTRIYYVIATITDRFVNEIKINNNYYRIQNDAYIVNNNKDLNEYIGNYDIDNNSDFKVLGDKEIVKINNSNILKSNNYDLIKQYYNEIENNSILQNDYKISDTQITNIQENTTQEKFTEKLQFNEIYQIKRNGKNISESDIIATGDSLETETGKTYILIVEGDIDKNGKVTINDLAILRKIILECYTPTDIQTAAADMDENNKITINDLAVMRKTILH